MYRRTNLDQKTLRDLRPGETFVCGPVTKKLESRGLRVEIVRHWQHGDLCGMFMVPPLSDLQKLWFSLTNTNDNSISNFANRSEETPVPSAAVQNYTLTTSIFIQTSRVSKVEKSTDWYWIAVIADSCLRFRNQLPRTAVIKLQNFLKGNDNITMVRAHCYWLLGTSSVIDHQGLGFKILHQSDRLPISYCYKISKYSNLNAKAQPYNSTSLWQSKATNIPPPTVMPVNRGVQKGSYEHRFHCDFLPKCPKPQISHLHSATINLYSR